MNQTGSERRGTGLGWAGALRASCLMAWMMTLMLAGTAHALSPGQQAAAEQAAQAAKPAAAPMLKSELQQFLVTVEKGETVFKPVGEVKPGDLIEYRAVYTNVGKAAVSEVVVDLPIPEATEYQPRTARPAGVLAAVVGRNFAPEPLMRDAANGKKEPVPYAEYRRLRWVIGKIAPGAKTTVTMRVRVAEGVAEQTAQAKK